MANPQVENGHLRIATEVWEKIMTSGMPAGELYLVMAVMRKTWGWKKKEEEISLVEFKEMTHQPERTIAHSLHSLVAKNVLIKVAGGGRGNPSKWSFNKDWETWKTVQPIAEFPTQETVQPIAEINPINSATHCRQTVQPIAEFPATHCTVSACNSLPGLENEPPTTTLKEKKAIAAEKRRTDKAKNFPHKDARTVPLKQFIVDEFKSVRGCKLITDNSDWTKLSTLLKTTVDDPAFSLENLRSSWALFVRSDEEFHLKQGHPLRFWACNINAFMDGPIKSRSPSKGKPQTDYSKFTENPKYEVNHEPRNLAAKGRGGS